MFDEIFDKVYPNIKEVQPIKPVVKNEIFGEFVPDDVYDIFYYYIIRPTMIYVNNYYEYEVYDPITYRNNMERAIRQYGHTMEEKAVTMCRGTAATISKVLDEYNVNTDKSYRVKIFYIWVAQSNACPNCMANDGKVLTSIKHFTPHYNCRCKLEEHIQYFDGDGELVDEKVKIL